MRMDVEWRLRGVSKGSAEAARTEDMAHTGAALSGNGKR